MPFEKRISINQITILEDGQIQVQEITRFIENGVELAYSFRRHVVVPGQGLTGEDARVVLAANAFHTPQVVADFNAAAEEARNRRP